MIIAIDYDNTYSADPETFDKVIDVFKSAGHTVICVTSRPEIMGAIVKTTIGKLVPCVFAGPDWKRDAAKKAGYDVDIWIDDNPTMIEQQVLVGGGWGQD